jgi:hypothetical protein
MKDKITHILVVTLVFFIVSNPMTYRFTDSLLTPLLGHLTYGSGLPTGTGLILHSIVFAALVWCMH